VGVEPKSDRPTVPPAFDVEQYAKDSDARLAKAARVARDSDPGGPASQDSPPSGTRLLTRPRADAALGDEAWASAAKGVLVVVMPQEKIKLLPLDHRAGFLLSLMDGVTDLETLLEISPMPRGEALRVVRDLFEAGVVDLRP
jgi:hypothetical protein